MNGQLNALNTSVEKTVSLFKINTQKKLFMGNDRN